MYSAIVAAHEAMSGELDIPVAWAVSVVHDLNDREIDFDLYAPDQSHPSYAGSYIAALTVMAVVFGVDPAALTYDGLLATPQAALCRDAASRAMKELIR